MPGINYEKLNGRAREFNRKYHTNFAYTGLLSKAETFKRLHLNNSANVVYKGTLGKVLKDVMLHACASERTGARGGAAAVDLQTVADEFEYYLMQPFVKECKTANEKLYPKPFGGMKEAERIEFIEQVVNSSPKNDVEITEIAYKNGDIRIRDMRSCVYEMDFTESISYQDLKRIGTFMLALENVNKSRTGWWRFLHPIRNNAEQREAKEMRTLLTSFRNNALNIAKKLALTEYSTITLTKESLNSAKAELEMKKEEEKKQEVTDVRDKLKISTIDNEKHEVSERVAVNENDTLTKSKNI